MNHDDSTSGPARRLERAMWRIYRRPERPALWQAGNNLPWHEPVFGERMLREHLDDAHGAASRKTVDRIWQLAWLWRHLALNPGDRVLDLTCGPGLYAVPLAERGCEVLGVDFNPAAIAYARELAIAAGVAGRCRFVQADVTAWTPEPARYDAVLFLYGQLAVFPPDQARRLLQMTATALRPGGRLCVELLDPDRVDRSSSRWWYTDDQGLWGDAPFLHLGERFWDAESLTSTERFLILHLETGSLDEILLHDQVYPVEVMSGHITAAGFAQVAVYAAWDGAPIADAAEWVVYVARRGDGDAASEARP